MCSQPSGETWARSSLGNRTGPRRGGQPAQALVEGEPALGEPVVRAGRDRQAAVGLSDGGKPTVTLYRYVGPQGELREQGQKVLAS